MLTHESVWHGIDALAKKKNTTVAKMAANAGLNPVLLHPDKRIDADKKKKWPTLRTLARVLNNTHTPLSEYAMLCERQHSPYVKPMPSAMGSTLNMDMPHITHMAPQISDLEIDKNSFIIHADNRRFSPTIRQGEKVVVVFTTNIRRDDKVIIHAHDKLYAGQIIQNTAYHLVLKNGQHEWHLHHKDIKNTLRLLWRAV